MPKGRSEGVHPQVGEDNIKFGDLETWTNIPFVPRSSDPLCSFDIRLNWERDRNAGMMIRVTWIPDDASEYV